MIRPFPITPSLPGDTLLAYRDSKERQALAIHLGAMDASGMSEEYSNTKARRKSTQKRRDGMHTIAQFTL